MARNLKDVQENLDDVHVEHEGARDVVLGWDLIPTATTDHLRVDRQVL